MTTVHVGLPAHQGSLERYAEHFDLLEVRPVATSLPRPTKLRQWRKLVPPAFAFSVVLPPELVELRSGPADAQARALKATLEAADALEARCLVLTTPPGVTPTALNKKRLAALLEQLPRDATHVGWEPRGIWTGEEADAWARELGVARIVDASQEEAPRGAVLYTRLRGIGANVRLGSGPLARVRSAMGGRREVFVIVESTGPKRVAQALRAPMADAASRPPTIGVLRPQVQAEDEEQ